MAKNDDEPTDLPALYIRERMRLRGVTGEELSERMNTTPATVSRLLNGRRQMTLAWLYAFAKALGVPIADLFRQPVATPSPEESLRAALLAFGVDKGDLGRAVSAVKIFAEEDSAQQSALPHHDQSGPANPRRAKEPS